jgi:hypothetical protein
MALQGLVTPFPGDFPMANSFPSDGPAGVGTANPTVGVLQLQVAQNQAATTRTGLALTVDGDGAPAMLYPRRNLLGGYDWYFTRNQQDTDGLALSPDGDADFGRNLSVQGSTTCAGGLIASTVFSVGCDGNFAKDLRIQQALEVGGRATVQADLVVQGAIKIKNWEIAVPDYVFEPGYRLPALGEVEAFVGVHGHLPEVPPAATLARDGMDAASMLLTLLKKVEELTLHLIRHERRLAAVEAAR